MIPTLFGHPLWFGNIKRRVAKKYLNRSGLAPFLKGDLYEAFSNFSIGGLINDCTGFNGVVLNIEPDYYPVNRGNVMFDVSLTTENTGCSLTHCGIEPPLPRDEIEKNHIHFMENWFFGDGGKMWYGGLDNPKHKAEIEFTKHKYHVLKNGGHIADSDGKLLSEFKFSARSKLL